MFTLWYMVFCLSLSNRNFYVSYIDIRFLVCQDIWLATFDNLLLFLYHHVRVTSVMSDQVALCSDKVQTAIKSYFHLCDKHLDRVLPLGQTTIAHTEPYCLHNSAKNNVRVVLICRARDNVDSYFTQGVIDQECAFPKWDQNYTRVAKCNALHTCNNRSCSHTAVTIGSGP